MNIKMFHRNNLPHELLLTTRQKSKLRNTFETDVKLSKAHIFKIIQFRGFLVSILSKIAGALMKVAILLGKYILVSLGIAVIALAFAAWIQKKIHGSGTTTLVISNEEINDILKIAQALEDSDILLKRVTKTIKNETKEQKGDFSS